MNEVINVVAEHWGLTLDEISGMTIPQFNRLVERIMVERRRMFVGGTYKDYVLGKHDKMSPVKKLTKHSMDMTFCQW